MTLSSPRYCYRAFGCNLVSDIPFEALIPGEDPSLKTITIRRCDKFSPRPKNTQQIHAQSWAAPGYFSISMPRYLTFEARGGDTLLYRPNSDAPEAALQVFLLGSGIGAILMQRGLLVLHGNAINMGGVCALCVGQSGAGKSTTAAGMMQRGHRVMSDDVCAIDPEGRVLPGIPHIKLLQAAADGLGVNTQGLSLVRPETDKYRVPMGHAFQAEPLAVQKIYVLTPQETDTVTCTPLQGPQKLLALREHTYRRDFLKGMGLNHAHFEQLAALSKAVQVSEVTRPVGRFALDELLDLLEADAKAP